MVRPEMNVGVSLLLMTTFWGQAGAHLPHLADYTPQVVKPLFDQMRRYGEITQKSAKKYKTYNQYLVVLIASDEEIKNTVEEDFSNDNWVLSFKNRFTGRLEWLPNKRDTKLENTVCSNRYVHGEIWFTESKAKSMLQDFIKIKGHNEFPIILMYSYYIPCACVQDLGYSCSEELGVFATNNWKKVGLLVAFSAYFSGTDVNIAKRFLRQAGIPTFRYEDPATDDVLVPDDDVIDANNADRWRSVTFLHLFFDCLKGEIPVDCLANDEAGKTVVLAFFVNSIAYQCFQNMAFLWREARKNDINNCFNDYIYNNIDVDCNQCNKNCGALKQQKAQECLSTSVKESLVPGQLRVGKEDIWKINPFQPTSWRALEDKELSKLFRKEDETKLNEMAKHNSCKDPSLTLQSLCTRKGQTVFHRKL